MEDVTGKKHLEVSLEKGKGPHLVKLGFIYIYISFWPRVAPITLFTEK